MILQSKHLKVLVSLICFVFSQLPHFVFSQESLTDSLILINGQIINEETKAPVQGRITFEKLPFGDDFGIANADSLGHFQVLLINKHKYLINIKAPGYLAHNEATFIEDFDKKGIILKTFHLTPIGIGAILRIKNLYFDQSTSVIPLEAYDELNTLVQMLRNNSTMEIQLEGHTDFRGSAKLNYKLSQERVEAIRDYFVGRGIEKKRIRLKAFGGSTPLSIEDTEEARRANRRVEVRILKL